MGRPELEGSDIVLVFTQLAPRSPIRTPELVEACREVGVRPATAFNATLFLLRNGVISLNNSEKHTKLELTARGQELLQKIGSLTIVDLLPSQTTDS